MEYGIIAHPSFIQTWIPTDYRMRESWEFNWDKLEQISNRTYEKVEIEIIKTFSMNA